MRKLSATTGPGGTAAVTTRRQFDGCQGRGRVGAVGSPVVADDDGLLVAAEGLVQGIGVETEHARLVAAVGCQRRRRVAALEGGDRPEAGVRERGEQVAEGVCRVGIAVQAQRERAGSDLEVGEVDAVRGHVLDSLSGHGVTLGPAGIARALGPAVGVPSVTSLSVPGADP